MEKLIEIKGISHSYPASTGLFEQRRRVRALEDISLEVKAGEIVAILGGSGSGKSTLGRIMSRLEQPETGSCIVRGKVQMIFQDPFASLNPAHTVGYHVRRALVLHGRSEDEAAALLEAVELRPGSSFLNKFPFELSGGQRQRVAIARALAVRPALLIADEPTSMLDVSIRMDILNLLKRLRETYNLAILLITHDLPSALYLSDRVAVMYAGRIVETGQTQAIFQQPSHSYTKLLWKVAKEPIATFDTALDGGRAFIARSPYAQPLSSTDASGQIQGGPHAVRCLESSIEF